MVIRSAWLTLLLMVTLVEGTIWTPESFPNPLRDPEMCGLSQPGKVCDPDRLLSEDGRKEVADILNSMEVNIRHFCDVKYPFGFPVGVAVMRSMDQGSSGSDRVEVAKQFAENVGTRWGLAPGHCDDAVMIAVSIDDGALGIQAWKYAKGEMIGDDYNRLQDTINLMTSYLTQKRTEDCVFQGVRKLQDSLSSDYMMRFCVMWVSCGLTALTVVCICCCWLGKICGGCCGGLARCVAYPYVAISDCIAARRQRMWARANELAVEDVVREALRSMKLAELEVQPHPALNPRPGLEQRVCAICLEELPSAACVAGLDLVIDIEPQTVVKSSSRTDDGDPDDSPAPPTSPSDLKAPAPTPGDVDVCEAVAPPAAASAAIEELPCAHRFHADCLLGWLNNAPRATCPLCRAVVGPDAGIQELLNAQNEQRCRLRFLIAENYSRRLNRPPPDANRIDACVDYLVCHQFALEDNAVVHDAAVLLTR